VAGLIQGASRPWALDLEDHNFKERDVLINSIVGSTSLTSLNKLSLADDPRLSSSLQRDRQLTPGGVVCISSNCSTTMYGDSVMHSHPPPLLLATER
jgi:hypothetical protein